MIKVLHIGYIPKNLGGKQTSGLASGIYDLVNHINTSDNGIESSIFATDINKFRIIENNKIYGWTTSLLIRILLCFPIISLKSFLYAISLRRYAKVFPISKIFFKRILIQYYIHKIDPDIVNVHGVFGAILINQISKREKIKVVLRIHGINGKNSSIENYITLRDLEKEITSYRFESVNYVTSSVMEEWNSDYGSFNTIEKVIYNGYDSKIFSKGQFDVSYDLITFAIVNENKGQLRVVEAIKRVEEKHAFKISYIIIGDSEKGYINHIYEYINYHKMKNIEIYPYISIESIPSYLKKSKYYILPSITEGFGKGIIESIACGLPAIVPKSLPIVRDGVLMDKVNCILLEDYSVDSIYNTLCDLFVYNKYVLSEDISKTVEFMNWNNIANQYSEYLEGIIKNN